MTRKTLISLLFMAAYLSLIFGCSNKAEPEKDFGTFPEHSFSIEFNAPYSYIIKPRESNIVLDLRMGDSNNLTSFAISDDSQDFSASLNLAEDGNFCFAVYTPTFVESTNTMRDNIDNPIVKYFAVNDKVYRFEIHNNGIINYDSRVK